MSKSGKPVHTKGRRNAKLAKPAKSVKPAVKPSVSQADKRRTSPLERHPDRNAAVAAAAPRLSSVLQASSGPKRMPGGAEGGRNASWKSLVQRYVSLFNQAEAEQHARALNDYIADEVHHARLSSRMERLRERDLLRGAVPAGSETKAELLRVNESPQEVSVLLRLLIRRRMEQGGMLYTEERYENERLWLSAADGEWRIAKVEPVVAERRPRFGAGAQETPQADESDSHFADDVQLMPSLPYLNYDLLPRFKNRVTGIRYRRDLAAAYADRWWNAGNPAYELFEVNCTHYVSQCIFAGNAPMNYTGKRDSGWWYKGRSKGREWWSYSWAVSNSMSRYLSAARKSGLRAEIVDSPEQLQLGDVIVYDWNGDNRFQHSTIVTAFDSSGMPLVNANTVASRHRYWDYRDSYAWTERTRYRFFHISDLM